jgi:hypothetical protein
MEIAVFREQSAQMGLPQDMVESLIADYIHDSKELGEAMPLEEILDFAKECYPEGYVDPRE